MKKGELKKNIKAMLLVLVVALLAVFIFQNMAIVSIQFLLWQVQASRAVIYLSLFLAGLIAGWLMRSFRR